MHTGEKKWEEWTLPARLSWSRLPTPIHRLTRLSQEWGVNLFVKRDDLTGFITGGNKVRKLDFLFREALDKKASAVISCGGLQSNHCRAVAALAAHHNLECILILRGEAPKAFNANLLLDKLLGAQILYVTDEQYENREELRLMVEAQVRERGGLAYYIPEGGSNPLGCVGYLEAWREIQSQLGGEDPYYSGGLPEHFDSLVFATGSGGTQVGLILGKLEAEAKALDAGLPIRETRVVGVNVCYDTGETFQIVKDLLWKAISHHRLPYSFMAKDIDCLDGFIGRGYALSTPAELEFIAKVARTEGLVLDPVYSGKAMYGLWQSLQRNKGAFGENILFIHTGGAFGNFKIESEWAEVLQ